MNYPTEMPEEGKNNHTVLALSMGAMFLVTCACSRRPVVTDIDRTNVLAFDIMQPIPPTHVPIEGRLVYFELKHHHAKEIWLSGRLDTNMYMSMLHSPDVKLSETLHGDKAFNLAKYSGYVDGLDKIPLVIDTNRCYDLVYCHVPGRRAYLIHNNKYVLMNVIWWTRTNRADRGAVTN